MLGRLTITEAHEGLVQKKFSAQELTRACLDRIHNKNEELNAFITVTDDVALASAVAADEKIKRGDALHPLEGIPFSVKDAICVQGIRATAGAHILDNYVAPYTATVIQRLLDAGSVLVGKANCDAFGHGASNENSDYGPVKNPWDTTKVSGGSSGGSAVSVAADMCLFGIAEDTGGSIRQPASFCSISGLKVSYGRTSRYGCMPMASSLDTVGPMAKNVFDLALIMETIAGKDPLDGTTVPMGVPEYRTLLEDDMSGMTLGLPKEYFSEIHGSEVEGAVMAALDAFKKRGVQVKEVSLPHTKYAVPVYYIIVPSEDSSNLGRLDGIRYGSRVEEDVHSLLDVYQKSRAKGFPDEVKRRIMIGTYALSAGYYDAYYKTAQKVRTVIKNEFDAIFKSVDFLVTPTSPFPAFGIGEKKDDILQMYLADIFVGPASVAGVPALNVPCGFTKDGLPIGMQLIGPRYREEVILRAGHQFQLETDWHIKKASL